MTFGNEPPKDYPRGPHLIHHRHRDILAQLRFILDTLRDQGGTAQFITYGPEGEQRLRQLQDKLPRTKHGLITKGDPKSPLAGAQDKYLRHQCSLLIRPADQVPDVILTEDPQAQLITEYEEQLEAEKTRLRAEYPGWRHNSDPPDNPDD